jgi:prepilin-type N-terminal cleavage/methylation domain-containing protein
VTAHARSPARRGFTLLEMLAVILLTALVLTVAADYYLDLSAAGNAAVEALRGPRRATRLLDRVARDLEGAVLLVKAPEEDPLRHPWLFLAEADDEREGARRVKLVTRSHRPRGSEAREEDLAVVAWIAEPELDRGLVLRRALWPQLPEELDRSFPRGEEEGAYAVAEGLARFGVRLLTEEGDWVSRFDSSSLVQSGQLPRAAEIELAFLEPDETGEWVEGRRYRRRVLLPLRPLDLAAELEAAGGAGAEDEEEDGEGEEEDGEEEDGQEAPGATVGSCLDRAPAALLARVPRGTRDVLESMRSRPLTAELRQLAAGFGVQCP